MFVQKSKAISKIALELKDEIVELWHSDAENFLLPGV